MILKSITIWSCCVLSVATPAWGQTPEVRAASEAAAATNAEAAADTELPAPEVMLDVWRMPLQRPYAVNEADMIRLGVQQEISSPGERSARKQAAALRARAEQAGGAANARSATERLAHVRVELWLVEHLHQVHQRHLELAERTLALARARHAAGGALLDVTNAELGLASASAELAGDAERLRADAQLAQVLSGVAPAPAGGERAELLQLRLLGEAERAQARAEGARSSWPDFRVGASYFAPTSGRAEHGFGVTLGMKLPWLWGGQKGRQSAASSRARALEQELAAKRRDLAADSLQARGAWQAASSRLRVLREQVLPAAERATELALSAYQSGQAGLADALGAEAARVNVELQIVSAEGEQRHRAVELEFLEGRPEVVRAQGAEHVR